MAATALACLLASALLPSIAVGAEQEAEDEGKAQVLADETCRGFSVCNLNAAIFQAGTVQEEEEEPHEIPVVSGNEELDRYLDFILETVVGYDDDALRRAYEWIGNSDAFPYRDMDYVSQDDPWEEWSVPCAIQMVRMEGGNCYRFAGLMCWVARALGYEARAVAGEVLVSSGWVYHGWVEVDVDGQTYIIDAQQHGRDINEGLDFFMVTYDDAPFYYRTEW